MAKTAIRNLEADWICQQNLIGHRQEVRYNWNENTRCGLAIGEILPKHLKKTGGNLYLLPNV